MDSRLTRWCDGFLEACWLVAILTIPLFFNIHSERVFEPDKLALLRSLAVLMVAAALARWVDQRGWRSLGRWRFSDPQAFWHKPFVLPVAALIVVYLLATIFSIGPRISWAGSYQRLQGTYTTLAYIVIFGLMAITIRSQEQVRRVVSSAIVASIPVALYGLLQHFGHDPLPWGGDVETRVAGHMGNAIFIAAYLIMVIPLTLARVVDAFSNILADEKLAAADVARASIYIFALAIQLLTLYWSGSRGPLIGLAVGLFSFTLVLLVSLRDAAGGQGRDRPRELLPALLFLAPTLVALLLSPVVSQAAGPAIAFAFFGGVIGLSVLAIFLLVAARRGWRWLWLGWILLTVLAAGWLVLFNIPAERTAGWRNVPLAGDVLDTLDEWRELPVVGSYGRMLDPSNTTGREKSGRVRVLIWEGVVDLISPHEPLTYPDGHADPFNWLRPILGYGPESMYSAYNRFYPPELATVEARNASPDRSHNETFDTLVITGLAGLLAWQALYLTVVHFAFRYLGVVRSRRDTLVFAGLWAAGALLAAAATLTLAEAVYLGVAVPVGVILGVIIYLIYFALLGRPAEDSNTDRTDQKRPFAADRLLMNALVAAVLAHYVEIHFGIAISATRLYFFVFVALMVALGYRLRQVASEEPEAPAPVVAATRGDKRKRRAAVTAAVAPARAGWDRLIAPALLLVLTLGTMGYGFISYALPPGKVINSPADLAVAEIFHQSLLQNARRDFVEWPFILSLFVLSWLLGWLVYLSEMVKQGELALPTPDGTVSIGRRQAAVGVLLALALGGLAARLLIEPGTATAALGASLALIGAVICGAAAAHLLFQWPAARRNVSVWGAALVILGLPVLMAGAYLPALAMMAGGAAVLWLLGGSQRGQSIVPAAAVIFASLVGGFAFIYLHAINYRSLLFYRGGVAVDSVAVLRALEAAQAGGLLTFFFGFVILIILLLAFALSWPELSDGRRPRTAANPAVAYGSLALSLLAAVIILSQSNVRPVQADMIYKRARPYDDQASRATQADPAARRDAWDTAIAIYTTAIERVPAEDFYYLFLGRAYLERAAVTENPVEQTELLARAESLLLQAQTINPLNTDHTANLARLNTRWYAVADEPEKAERLDLAERYYEQALLLSPQNSIIRNELARLLLEVRGDCDRGLALYDESAAIDPFYMQTQLARADAYILCSSGRPEAERDTLFRTAAAALEEALADNPNNIRAWVQLAEIYRQLGEFDQAAIAVEQARAVHDPATFPTAEIDFLAAQIAVGLGNVAEARELAERALETAGGETAAQIESFLAGLGIE